MTRQEQRMVMQAILGSLLIRQLYEIVVVALLPDYRELSLWPRLLIGIAIAIGSYVIIIRVLRARNK